MHENTRDKSTDWSVVILSLPRPPQQEHAVRDREVRERALLEYYRIWQDALTLNRGYVTPYSISPYILSGFDRDEPQLPAEIADGLTEMEAKRIAARLGDIGVEALPARTASIGEVQYRAADLWPERAANGFGFSEWQGMVLLGNSRHAQSLEDIPSENDTMWSFERFHNHIHQQMSAPDRQHLAQERAYAAELTTALRLAYPDRPFIVTHITLYAVSFYQPTSDAPGAGITILQVPDLTAETYHCYQCQTQAAHTLLPEPDVIVPELRWARCESCGAENLLGEAEICIAVS